MSQRSSCGAKYHPNSHCDNCDLRMCTYASHIEYATDPSSKILGNAEQFCEAMFHVYWCPEYRVETHRSIFNATKDDCRPQCVSMVVKIGQSFLGRYTNCGRIHCEQFMVEDVILREALAKSKCKNMLVYLKFQPCHHSSGNPRRFRGGYLFNGKADSRSCATILVDFYEKCLKPQGKQLTIVPSSFYKANWDFVGYRRREDDEVTVANAKEGICMMMRHGISFRAMTPKDWLFLAKQTTNVKPFQLSLLERIRTDVGNARFLAQCQQSAHGAKQEATQKQEPHEAPMQKKQRVT